VAGGPARGGRRGSTRASKKPDGWHYAPMPKPRRQGARNKNGSLVDAMREWSSDDEAGAEEEAQGEEAAAPAAARGRAAVVKRGTAAGSKRRRGAAAAAAAGEEQEREEEETAPAARSRGRATAGKAPAAKSGRAKAPAARGRGGRKVAKVAESGSEEDGSGSEADEDMDDAAEDALRANDEEGTDSGVWGVGAAGGGAQAWASVERVPGPTTHRRPGSG
jgi:hypothetical protein